MESPASALSSPKEGLQLHVDSSSSSEFSKSSQRSHDPEDSCPDAEDEELSERTTSKNKALLLWWRGLSPVSRFFLAVGGGFLLLSSCGAVAVAGKVLVTIARRGDDGIMLGTNVGGSFSLGPGGGLRGSPGGGDAGGRGQDDSGEHGGEADSDPDSGGSDPDAANLETSARSGWSNGGEESFSFQARSVGDLFAAPAVPADAGVGENAAQTHAGKAFSGGGAATGATDDPSDQLQPGRRVPPRPKRDARRRDGREKRDAAAVVGQEGEAGADHGEEVGGSTVTDRTEADHRPGFCEAGFCETGPAPAAAALPAQLVFARGLGAERSSGSNGALAGQQFAAPLGTGISSRQGSFHQLFPGSRHGSFHLAEVADAAESGDAGAAGDRDRDEAEGAAGRGQTVPPLESEVSSLLDGEEVGSAQAAPPVTTLAHSSAVPGEAEGSSTRTGEGSETSPVVQSSPSTSRALYSTPRLAADHPLYPPQKGGAIPAPVVAAPAAAAASGSSPAAVAATAEVGSVVGSEAMVGNSEDDAADEEAGRGFLGGVAVRSRGVVPVEPGPGEGGNSDASEETEDTGAKEGFGGGVGEAHASAAATEQPQVAVTSRELSFSLNHAATEPSDARTRELRVGAPPTGGVAGLVHPLTAFLLRSGGMGGIGIPGMPMSRGTGTWATTPGMTTRAEAGALGFGQEREIKSSPTRPEDDDAEPGPTDGSGKNVKEDGSGTAAAAGGRGGADEGGEGDGQDSRGHSERAREEEGTSGSDEAADAAEVLPPPGDHRTAAAQSAASQTAPSSQSQASQSQAPGAGQEQPPQEEGLQKAQENVVVTRDDLGIVPPPPQGHPEDGFLSAHARNLYQKCQRLRARWAAPGGTGGGGGPAAGVEECADAEPMRPVQQSEEHASGEPIPAGAESAEPVPTVAAPRHETAPGGGDAVPPPAASAAIPSIDGGRLEVAPQAVAPPEVSPQEVAPQAVALPGVAPQAVAPQEVAPQAVAPQAVAPPEVAPQAVAPPEVAPQAVALPEQLGPNQKQHDHLGEALATKAGGEGDLRANSEGPREVAADQLPVGEERPAPADPQPAAVAAPARSGGAFDVNDIANRLLGRLAALQAAEAEAGKAADEMRAARRAAAVVESGEEIGGEGAAARPRVAETQSGPTSRPGLDEGLSENGEQEQQLPPVDQGANLLLGTDGGSDHKLLEAGEAGSRLMLAAGASADRKMIEAGDHEAATRALLEAGAAANRELIAAGESADRVLLGAGDSAHPPLTSHWAGEAASRAVLEAEREYRALLPEGDAADRVEQPVQPVEQGSSPLGPMPMYPLLGGASFLGTGLLTPGMYAIAKNQGLLSGARGVLPMGDGAGSQPPPAATEIAESAAAAEPPGGGRVLGAEAPGVVPPIPSGARQAPQAPPIPNSPAQEPKTVSRRPPNLPRPPGVLPTSGAVTPRTPRKDLPSEGTSAGASAEQQLSNFLENRLEPRGRGSPSLYVNRYPSVGGVAAGQTSSRSLSLPPRFPQKTKKRRASLPDLRRLAERSGMAEVSASPAASRAPSVSSNPGEQQHVGASTPVRRRHSAPANRGVARRDEWEHLQTMMRERHSPSFRRVPSAPKLEASFLSQAARLAHRGARLA